MRSDFHLDNPYSVVRVQSNNNRYNVQVLFSCGVPWVTLDAKNIIWLVYASLSCPFMFPAGVAISTKTLSSNVWSSRERVLSNRVKERCAIP